jgi:hypothetical protein
MKGSKKDPGLHKSVVHADPPPSMMDCPRSRTAYRETCRPLPDEAQ